MEISSIVQDLIEPLEDCLTPEVAQKVLGFRASKRFNDRLTELSERNSTGEITSSELEELTESVKVIRSISILQAKARTVLQS